MAHFKIKYPNGMIVEWKKSDHYEATNAYACGNAPEGTKFYLKGVEVTSATYATESENLHKQWYERKCKTHKEVRVLHGSSVACYVTKWVKI